jgi:hypothetical protein
VRPFELLVVSVFWWHPVAWWARRRLRADEERACDDLVLDALPGNRRAYADALLKTLEHLARTPLPTPTLATGAADRRRLEERLVMILRFRPTRRPSPFLRAALLAAIAGVLLVSPARLQGRALAATEEPTPPPAPVAAVEPPAPPAAVEAAPPEAPPLSEELLELHRQRAELQAERLRLQVEQTRLEARLERAYAEQQLQVVRQEIRALEEQGEMEAARALQAELARNEVEFEFQARRQELRAEIVEQNAQLEVEQQRLIQRLQELQASGLDPEELALREAELRSAEMAIERSQNLARRRELELQLQELDAIEALPGEDAESDGE